MQTNNNGGDGDLSLSHSLLKDEDTDEDRPVHLGKDVSDDDTAGGGGIESSPFLQSPKKSHVTLMLGDDPIGKFRKHDLFVELYELQSSNQGEITWQETARWIKYEEDVEGVDQHFGKPHVAFLSFHSLIQLRRCISRGTIMLDIEGSTYESVCKQVVEVMLNEKKLDSACKEAFLNVLLLRTRHGHDHQFHLPKALTTHALFRMGSYGHVVTDTSRKVSEWQPRRQNSQNFEHLPRRSISCANQKQLRGNGLNLTNFNSALSKHELLEIDENAPPVEKVQSPPGILKKKKSFFQQIRDRANLERVDSFYQENPGSYEADLMKKIPEGAESAQVFSGEIESMPHMRFALIRLKVACLMPEILEAAIPIRFIFFILGPQLPDVDYREIGRSIATLMSNKQFHELAYEASDKDALLSGIDCFLDESIVIPPGEIDSQRLLSAHDIQKALRKRKRHKQSVMFDQDKPEFKQDGEFSYHLNPRLNNVSELKRPSISFPVAKKENSDPLARTGVPFGAMARELKFRFRRFYVSDFADALNFQCVASLFFMFFAALAPAITFGGLLGDQTAYWLGTTETLLAQCICGVIWGLFAGQPLIITGATGPVLIFEKSLYKFCEDNNLEFLVIRFWVGVWLCAICLVLTMFEGSMLVKSVTRFTEDIFATLISLIFIYESFKFLISNFISHPVGDLEFYLKFNSSNNTATGLPHDHWSSKNICSVDQQTINFFDKEKSKEPNAALLSMLLLVATFALSFYFKQIRNSHFFSRKIRRAIGDFGVPLAILIVVAFYAGAFQMPYQQKLHISKEFSLTSPNKRGWLVEPLGTCKPVPIWAVFASFIPGFLLFILIFVETEITELLLARPERKLVKGSGFHWDMVLIGICTLVSSTLGLPWMCAAAVQSLAHASSLTVYKRTAPGQRPMIDKVIEQRVTCIGVALLLGACTFFGSVLQKIPLAVLFGVFLYLGVMNMVGIQMLHRMVLVIIPEKYYPDLSYCQQVHMLRMHLYTFIQIVSLALIWSMKFNNQSALAFPFVLILFVLVRQFCLPHIFTPKELHALDGESEQPEDENSDIEADFYEMAHGIGT